MTKTHGRKKDGTPITDEMVEALADEAEAGYDVEEILRRRGGRPTMGSSAASVESVRLDPDLKRDLILARRRGAHQCFRGHPASGAPIPPRELISKFVETLI